MRNVIVVATAKDTVFAFDADANPCVQLWKTNLIPAGQETVSAPNFDIPTDDISPFIGITGTPVIDPRSGTIFVVAESRTASFDAVYDERLYSLDLDRKSTRLNSSHQIISYAVFCLKKKKTAVHLQSLNQRLVILFFPVVKHSVLLTHYKDMHRQAQLISFACIATRQPRRPPCTTR